MAEQQLPTEVQRMVDEAEKIEQGLAGAQNTDSPNTEVQEQPSEDSAPEEEAAPTVEETIADLQRQLDSARVEQGRVRALSQQLTQAQEQIAQLTAKVEEASKRPEQIEIQGKTRDELIDSFGEELVEYVESMVSNVKTDVDKVQTAVADTSKNVAETAFWNSLNSAHPKWEELQSSKLGQQFLLTAVPYDRQGRTFDDLLQEAAREFDASGAIEVFNGLAAHIESNKAADPKDRLKEQVVPGNGPGGQPLSQSPKPVISMSDFQESSLDYAKTGSMEIPMKYGAKTMDEWDQMVNEAMADGRMR